MKRLDLSESRIRYAMENTNSNRAAAAFLHVSFNTYKKYAKIYTDETTGLSLYELHKNQSGKGISKGSVNYSGYYKLQSVLEGQHPNYSPVRLRNRLLKSNIIPHQCQHCGFNEKRFIDGAVPLMLDWIDGDKTNHKLSNLRWLCYNCYFLLVDNVVGKKLKLQF